MFVFSFNLLLHLSISLLKSQAASEKQMPRQPSDQRSIHMLDAGRLDGVGCEAVDDDSDDGDGNDSQRSGDDASLRGLGHSGRRDGLTGVPPGTIGG